MFSQFIFCKYQKIAFKTLILSAIDMFIKIPLNDKQRKTKGLHSKENKRVYAWPFNKSYVAQLLDGLVGM